MKTLVFIYEYLYIYDSIRAKCKEYNTILIVDHDVTNLEEAQKVFNEVIVVEDIFDKNEMLRIMSQIVSNHDVFRVITSYEGAMNIAGYLRSKFNIDGLNEEQTMLVRDKYLMKKRVEACGVKVPKCNIISSREDMNNFVNEFGFPLIIKPISSCGTISTYKCESIVELDRNLEKMINENGYPFLSEEYILGSEFHCDSIVVDGKVEYVSIGKYMNNCLDSMNNMNLGVGSISIPISCHENGMLNDMKKVNEIAIKSLGVQRGICHAEYFVTPFGEIYFSELAARIGGGNLIAPTIEKVHGINVFDYLLDIELGQYSLKVNECNNFVGSITFPNVQGKIKKISEVDEFKDIEGLVHVEISYKVGDELEGMNWSGASSGLIVIEDKNYHNLFMKLLKARNSFEIEVE